MSEISIDSQKPPPELEFGEQMIETSGLPTTAAAEAAFQSAMLHLSPFEFQG